MELETGNPEKKRRVGPLGKTYISPGCVKGYPHRAEGECNTRAFPLPVLPSRACPSIITSLTSLTKKKTTTFSRQVRLSRLFPFASIRLACA